MLVKVAAIELPAWAVAEVEKQCAERGVSVEELVKYLVCADVKAATPPDGAQFTVPHAMEPNLAGDDFVVVRRNERGVTLTHCHPMSFDDALAEFHANDCTEDDVLLVMERNSVYAGRV